MLVKTYFLCLRRNKFHFVLNCREKFKFKNSISLLVILVSVISGEFFFRSESELSFGDRTKGQNTAVQEVQKNNQCQALSKHLKILFLFSVSMLTVDCPRGGLLRTVTTPALPWMDIRWARWASFSKLNFFTKKGLVLQNSQRRESFLYKSGSDYDVASPRWGKILWEKKYAKKIIQVNVQSLLLVLRVWTHRG